jgi:hypothetical protein
MNYGFENNKFYIDITSTSRPHGNMREEHEFRAKEIAESNDKLWVGLSSGVDSQSILHSFHSLGVDATYAFMYFPGYNDNEYKQIKILEKKYNIQAAIFDFDPIKIQAEAEALSKELDVHSYVNIFHTIFLKSIPEYCNFIQMTHDPFVYVDVERNKQYFYQGYYLAEISRDRAFKKVHRSGKTIFWGDYPEFLMSILDDDVYKAAIYTARYFDGNGATVAHKSLKTLDRWDYYIKPIIYGKYWKDELIYFPKFGGQENIPYAYNFENGLTKKHSVAIPYFDFLNFLGNQKTETKRFYQYG